MNTQKIIYAVAGLVLGFFLGFLFTNSVNRKELDSLRAEAARLRAGGAKEPAAAANTGAPNAADNSKGQLTEEELRNAIAKGDSAPADIPLQRKLGHGLYLYAINFRNPALLPDAVRMLKRATDADPKDFETLTLLGNALFDWGQASDPAHIDEARTYFQKALEIKPDDPEARTALGLTYYFDKPADPARAIREYRKALAVNPKHEMTLQSLAAALITSGELAEARQRVEELQAVNPSNPALGELRGQLAQKAGSAQAGANTAGAPGEQH